MKFIVDSREVRHKKKEMWHRWFAWHPVWLETSCNKTTIVWLETVERSGELKNTGPMGVLEWNYKYRHI